MLSILRAPGLDAGPSNLALTGPNMARIRLLRNHGTKPPQKSCGLGRAVMTEKNNQRSDPLARELQELPFAGLQQIGKELRIKLTEIIGEPLPDELQALLEKLEQELDQK